MYLHLIDEADREQVNRSREKSVLDLVRSGILRPQDVAKKGLASDYFWRLHKQGKLEKVGCGMYSAQGAALSDKPNRCPSSSPRTAWRRLPAFSSAFL